MGLFKELFKNKQSTSQPESPVIRGDSAQDIKSGPDYSISDLILLHKAEGFKYNQRNFPVSLQNLYGISFPLEGLKKLESYGDIAPGTPKQSLPKLKISELKSIARKHGISSAGNKASICARISAEVEDSALLTDPIDLYWTLTDQGKAKLQENQFLSFILESHPYSLDNCGISDTWLQLNTQKMSLPSIRNKIWGELNRLSMSASQKAYTKGDFNQYCSILRTQALFLEEEEKYLDALRNYLHFINVEFNLMGSLHAIHVYSLTKKMADVTENLYMATSAPHYYRDLYRLISLTGMDSNACKSFILDTLTEQKDKGFFSPPDLTEYLFLGLSKDTDKQKKLCTEVVKANQKIIKSVH